MSAPGVSALAGGVCFHGGCPLGVSSLGGCLLLKGLSAFGVYAKHPLPPVNRITDRCKNITLLQLRCAQ